MRRYFSGPGLDNYDMALLKTTTITESTKLQFRAEAFNVFNHAQFEYQNRGHRQQYRARRIRLYNQARDPRIMQVALKFLF